MFKNQQAFFEVLLMAALFAPSFLFVKVAVQYIDPITLIAIRVGLAGLITFFILKIKRSSFSVNLNILKHCFILGFFANGFPFVCYSYSLTLIPTSLSALINGMTPIITVFLANSFLENEKINLNRSIGVILGLAGFIVLLLPRIFSQNIEFDYMGILLCFIGAISYAIAAVYAKKYVTQLPFLVAPTLQLLTSLLYLIPLSFIFESPLKIVEVPLIGWACVIGVTLLGTTLAFIQYHRIINLYGATVLSMSAYLLPLLGTLLGVTFLGEILDNNFVISAVLIFSGLAVINGMIRLPRFVRP